MDSIQDFDDLNNEGDHYNDNLEENRESIKPNQSVEFSGEKENLIEKKNNHDGSMSSS